MKLIKNTSGEVKISLHKSEWLSIGKKAGWTKEAQVRESLPTIPVIEARMAMPYDEQSFGQLNCFNAKNPSPDYDMIVTDPKTKKTYIVPNSQLKANYVISGGSLGNGMATYKLKNPDIAGHTNIG